MSTVDWIKLLLCGATCQREYLFIIFSLLIGDIISTLFQKPANSLRIGGGGGRQTHTQTQGKTHYRTIIFVG